LGLRNFMTTLFSFKVGAGMTKTLGKCTCILVGVHSKVFR
jgi:hypothetical protein